MLLPEQTITSFSPKACLYRAIHREEVDFLFEMRFKPRIDVTGRKIYPSRREKLKYDTDARQYWRYIIIESNKL